MILSLLLTACGGSDGGAAPSSATPGGSAGPVVVASTTWAGAFAKAAGAENVTVIAPASVVHPPDYDPKASDLTGIASADFVLYAPFDSFAPRIKEAAGGTARLVEVKLENTAGNIGAEVTRLGQLFGTPDKAAAWLMTFGAEQTRLAASAREAVPEPAPTAVSHMFMAYWGEFAGVAVTGTYGPEPLSATQLADLTAKKPTLVLANSHLPPSPDIPGARTVQLVNFPQADLDLLAVFRTNADRLTAALKS